MADPLDFAQAGKRVIAYDLETGLVHVVMKGKKGKFAITLDRRAFDPAAFEAYAIFNNQVAEIAADHAVKDALGKL